jgi:hypothetical protein
MSKLMLYDTSTLLPIRFAGSMVLALMDDLKTQTRRIANPDKPCPYGKPGDRLWVQEKWAVVDHSDTGLCLRYAAEPEGPDHWIYPGETQYKKYSSNDCWRPSKHMPKCASRLTLSVKDIRLEHLQDLSESDAEAEGMVTWRGKRDFDRHTALEEFRLAWNQFNYLNPDYYWMRNPLVWVVSFRKVSA